MSIDFFIYYLYNYSMGQYDKTLETINERNQNYTELRDSLINAAKSRYGADIFSNLSLPKDFQLNALGKDHFEQRYYQTTALPYTDKQFAGMLSSPKVLINTPFMLNKKGKNIFGVYMLGRDSKNKPVLYALTVIRDPKFKNNFSIKLDVCPQGKVWLDVARLDSEGPNHPNFFVGGKLAKNESEVEYSPTPHLHKQSEKAQVLFHDNLTYTTATDLSKAIDLEKSHKDNTFFKTSFDWFVEKTNIDIQLNQSLTGDYDYNFGNPLVDYDSTTYVDTPENF